MASTLRPTSIQLPSFTPAAGLSVRSGRQRSGSLVKVEKVEPSQDEALDESMYDNVNAEWVNRKGAHAMRVLVGLAC